MTDRNLTDIIKALECCHEDGGAQVTPSLLTKDETEQPSKESEKDVR